MLVQIPMSAADRSTAWSTRCTRSPSSNEASAQPSFSTAAYVLAASRPTITNISGANGKSKNRGATHQGLAVGGAREAGAGHGHAQGLCCCHFDFFLAERKVAQRDGVFRFSFNGTATCRRAVKRGAAAPSSLG